MRASASGLLACLIGVPLATVLLAAGAQEETLERRVFALPEGTRSDYRATLKITVSGKSFLVEAKVTALRPGGDGSEELVLLIKEGGDVPASEPVVFLPLRADGRPRPGAVGETDGLLARSLPGALLVNLRGPGFAPGARWKRDQRRAGEELMLMGGTIEHAVERDRDRPDALRLHSRKVGEGASFSTLMPIAILAFERDLLWDEASGRPLSVRLSKEMDARGTPFGPQKHDLRVEETAHRRLTPEELAALPGEMASLRTVVAAARARLGAPAGGGFLDRLLGRTAGVVDPIRCLDEHQRAHPRGVLASASGPLRRYIQDRLEAKREEEAVRKAAEKLLGNPAPDFTLRDLDGKQVSLRDFRGKAVLLSFWGYG